MDKFNLIKTRLCNQVLAIEATKLNEIVENITIPLILGQEVRNENNISATVPNFNESNIINVFGSLVAKNGAGASGVTSYQRIASQITNAVQLGNKKLYFYVDSLGGEVAGLFGLSNFIASLPAKYGVQTFGFTDGAATSAAYEILAATQNVYAMPSSSLGSIGVIMSLFNVTEADKKDGITYTILRSKEQKALFNPHEGLSDEVIADANRKLLTYDRIFNESVHSHRSKVTFDVIDALKGASVLGEEAKTLHLIDGLVSSFDELLSLTKTTTSSKFYFSSGAPTAMTLEELMAENIKLKAELDTLKANTKLTETSILAAERERVAGILTAASTLNIKMSAVEKRIKSGTSVEEATDIFTELAEVAQTNNPSPKPINLHDNTPTGGDLQSMFGQALKNTDTTKTLFTNVN